MHSQRLKFLNISEVGPEEKKGRRPRQIPRKILLAVALVMMPRTLGPKRGLGLNDLSQTVAEKQAVHADACRTEVSCVSPRCVVRARSVPSLPKVRSWVQGRTQGK